jgi:hypothetical protein
MENFAESNYQSTNFFFNQADILIILAIMFLYFVVALVLHFIFKNKTLYFKRSLEGFRYNAFIRLVTEDYLPIIVPCLITLKKVSRNSLNAYDYLNYPEIKRLTLVKFILFCSSTLRTLLKWHL